MRHLRLVVATTNTVVVNVNLLLIGLLLGNDTPKLGNLVLEVLVFALLHNELTH